MFDALALFGTMLVALFFEENCSHLNIAYLIITTRVETDKHLCLFILRELRLSLL